MSDQAKQHAQLVLIRHAPIALTGRLMGRTDAPARIVPEAIAAMRPVIGTVDHVVTSPAQRCRHTAAALWPGAQGIGSDERLWEQDFGDHDGLEYAALPDLGILGNAELAAYAPPNGESFDHLCARVWPALNHWASVAFSGNQTMALLVHAGVVRAALAMVLGSSASGMCFEVEPLSITRLRVGPDGPVSVIEVNRTCP